MKRRFFSASASTYTVLSNCEGGQVYFNGNLVGTIKDGEAVIKINNGLDSYKVQITGGVPTSTETIGYETVTETKFDVTDTNYYPITSITTKYQDGTEYFYVISNTSTIKITWLNSIIYGSPSTKTVHRDGIVVMNYSVSTSKKEKSRETLSIERINVTATKTSDPSGFVTMSKKEEYGTGDKTGYKFTVSISYNVTYSSRVAYYNISTTDDSKQLQINQLPKQDRYLVMSNAIGARVMFTKTTSRPDNINDPNVVGIGTIDDSGDCYFYTSAAEGATLYVRFVDDSYTYTIQDSTPTTNFTSIPKSYELNNIGIEGYTEEGDLMAERYYAKHTYSANNIYGTTSFVGIAANSSKSLNIDDWNLNISLEKVNHYVATSNNIRINTVNDTTGDGTKDDVKIELTRDLLDGNNVKIGYKMRLYDTRILFQQDRNYNISLYALINGHSAVTSISFKHEGM